MRSPGDDTAPRLFLINFSVRVEFYLGPTNTYNAIRLVWADSAGEAEKELHQHLEVDDRYGRSVTIDIIETSEAIGEFRR